MFHRYKEQIIKWREKVSTESKGDSRMIHIGISSDKLNGLLHYLCGCAFSPEPLRSEYKKLIDEITEQCPEPFRSQIEKSVEETFTSLQCMDAKEFHNALGTELDLIEKTKNPDEIWNQNPEENTPASITKEPFGEYKGSILITKSKEGCFATVISHKKHLDQITEATPDVLGLFDSPIIALLHGHAHLAERIE